MKMRRAIGLLTAIFLILSVFSSAIYAEEQYQDISTAEQFLEIEKTGNYRLISDISFEGMVFEKSYVVEDFSGVLDGNGYSLKGISIDITENSDESTLYCGVFAENSGSVRNLSVVDSLISVSLQTTSDYVNVYCGAICAVNTGEISNCVASDTVVFGSLYTTSRAPYRVVTTASYVGGIVGLNSKTVQGCFSSGSVTSRATSTFSEGVNNAVAGGIVGRDNDTHSPIGSSIKNCCSSATVDGSLHAGGIVGETSNTLVRNCFFSGSVIADVNAGGIIGSVSYTSDIYGCVNKGSVTCKEKAGGIAGIVASTNVSACRNDGTVSVSDDKLVAKLYAGGILGQVYSSVIKDCLNTGEVNVNAPGVTSYIYVGGIAGAVNKIVEHENYVSDCLNTGDVISFSTKLNQSGAIVGRNYNSTVYDCYYLKDSYSTAISFGEASAVELSSDDLKTESNLSALDFSAKWKMGDAFPVLVLPEYLNVFVTGSPVYRSILRATVYSSEENVSYQWQRNGVNVGKNQPTYTLYKADIGSQITVTVTAGKASYTSQSVTVEKISQDAPSAPMLQAVQSTSVTLQEESGREYSCNGTTWQSSNVFENLKPDTEYCFYLRRPMSDGYYESEKSKPLTVFTPAVEAQLSAHFSGEAVYASTLTATVEGAPENSVFSYQWYLDDVPVGKNTPTYIIYSAAYGKTVSCVVTVNNDQTVTCGGRICKQAQKTPPAAPVLEQRTSNSITVETVSGCEYSIDGKTWQSTGFFEGLEQGTVYTVYTRRPGSDNYTTSIARKLKVITAVETSDFTVKISGQGVYNTALTAEISGIDTTGKTVTYQWQRGSTLVGANSNNYICYFADIGFDVTVTVTIDGKVAVSSAIVPVKAEQARTNPPRLEQISEKTISLVAEPGREYSLDGENWQKSNIFSDLESGVEYFVYMRRGSSKAYNAGIASRPLKVTVR